MKVKQSDFIRIEHLLYAIKSIPNICSVEVESLMVREREILFISLLVLLWGFDPIAASLILHTEQQANTLTLMRFAVVSITLGIYWIYLKRGEGSAKGSVLPPPLYITLAGFALFIMALSSYLALREISPLLYNNFMVFITLVLGVSTISSRSVNRNLLTRYGWICLILLIGLLGLSLTLPLQYAILLTVAVFSYTLYLYFLHKVDSYLESKVDLISSQFYIHFIAFVLAGILILIKGFDTSPTVLAQALSFAVVFNILPIMLYRKYALLSLVRPERGLKGMAIGLCICFLSYELIFRTLPPLFDMILFSGTVAAFIIQIVILYSAKKNT